ncbi:MAG: type II secretion system F family protein [Gemmatimonadota bacterium]
MVLAVGLAAFALAIILLVLAVAPARRQRGGVAVALAAIEERYAHRPGGRTRGKQDALGMLPGWTRALALRLSPASIGATMQRRLDLAGNPARWTADRVLAVKGLGLVALALVGGFYGVRSPILLVLGAAVGGTIGFFLPDLLLYNAGLKRQTRIQGELPDALDMLTICVEAGLGFDAAIAQVARNTHGPLAAEFTRLQQEMQIGMTRTEALRAVLDRTTVTELRAFVSALVQASELGIPVAQVLRSQAAEMRLVRRQRAEEKAQKVGVKVTFPLIACLFPAIFVVVIGPGAITIAHALFGPHG